MPKINIIREFGADVSRETFKTQTMNENFYKYDVIVIGGGLAGSAAAGAASNAGARTLLISINMDSLAAMQFGNYFAAEDVKTALHHLQKGESLMTNIIRKNILAEVKEKNKGFEGLEGFWIIDRKRFALQVKEMLESQKKLDTRQALAAEVSDDKNGFIVSTSDSIEIKARSVIICAGTFLNASMCWGDNKIKAGRPGEIYSSRLYKSLIKRGLKFREGTLFSAPKILGNTIDSSPENIQIYKGGRAGIYSVSGIGKNVFGKTGKRLYLMPEGLETNEMYVYGFENDISEKEQINRLLNIKGLENIYMTRPGYRIEYGCLEADETGRELEAKEYAGLFFAGRITGTDSNGYSLLQGYLSGINAVRAIKGKKLISIDKFVKRY